MQNILFNDFGRLRSGWRFAVFSLLFIFFMIFFQMTAVTILTALPVGFSDKSFLNLGVFKFLELATAIIAGWICTKYLEGLPFRALGAWFTRNWLKDLLLGLIFGALTVSFAVLIAVVFGGLSFTFNTDAGQSAILLTMGVSLIIFAVAAAFEEAFFRGYMLQTFTRSGLIFFGFIFTSTLFALAHIRNPSVNIIAAVNTAIAGIWFCVAYLKTRNLWFPFGLHFMWNWMQGSFFGIEVSGLTDITTAPFLLEIDRGPVWLTGESYGIEGGIACTISLVVFTLLIRFLPIFKPTEEMLELTGRENPREEIYSPQRRGDAEEI